MIDHRASPGLPEDFARAVGYDPKKVGEGSLFEVATLHCSHCQARGVPNFARTRPRALCMECNNIEGHYICDACDFERHQPGYVHTPLAKKIDQYLTQTVLGSPPKLLIP